MIRDHRPWGWFDVLYEKDCLKVKRILVSPQQRLSLQSHAQRQENWIIIQGQAHIELDEKKIFLNENQSIHIPPQAKHRVENRGKTDLIFIEIQRGSYLGEDDIIRYEDDYGRIK